MIGTRPGTGHREHLYVSTTDTYDDAADLDLIAIEKAINGERVHLTTAEKLFAARFLDDRGMAPQTIAHLVGTKPGTMRAWKQNGWKRGVSGATGPRPRTEPVCGERRMYMRHRARGERCDVCRAANAEADRRYRLTGSTKATP